MKGKKPHPWYARTVPHRRRAAMGVVFALGLSFAAPSAAGAEELSLATRGLFAAIDRNDLAGVQTSLAQGARLDAQNAFGLRPVDIAIDRGYYEIAHFLLSVHNARPAAEFQTKAVTGPTTGPVVVPLAPPPAAAAPLALPTTEAPQKAEQAPAPVQRSAAPNPFDPQAVPEGASHPTVQGGNLPPTATLSPPPPPPSPPSPPSPPPSPAATAPQTAPVPPADSPAVPKADAAPSIVTPAKPATKEAVAAPAAKAPPPGPPKQAARPRSIPPVVPSALPPPSPPAPPPAIPAPDQTAVAETPPQPTATEAAVPYLSPTSEPPPPPDITIAPSMPPPPERPAIPAIADRSTTQPSAPPPAAAPDAVAPRETSLPLSIAAQPPETASQPAAVDQPAAADQPGFMSQVSARFQQATQSIDRTFEDMMGGWFFKWVGQRVGLIEKPARPKKATEVADSTSTTVPARDEAADPLKMFGQADGRTAAPAAENAANRPTAAAQDVASQNAAQAPLGALPGNIDIPQSSEDSAASLPATTESASADSGAVPGTGDLSPPLDGSGAPADPMLADLPPTTEQPTAPVATVQPPAKTAADKSMPPRPTTTTAKRPTKAPADSPPKAVAEKPVALLTPPADASATVPNPFAPDAVPPGADHPLIGDKVPVTPELPDAALPDATSPDAALRVDATAQPAPPAAKSSRPAVSAKAASAAKAATPAKPKAPGDSLENLLGELASPEPAKAPSGGAKKAGGGGLFGIEGPADTGTPAKPSSGGGLFGLEGPATTVAPRTTATPREGGGGGGLFGLDGPSNQLAVVSTPKAPRASAKSIPNTVLTLGESVHITAAMPPEPSDPVERNYCVKKNHGTVVFCIEPVDWPASMAKDLQVSSIMYQGARAIVRYDNEAATRFHAIFPTKTYGKLVAYYAKRFGKPTETLTRTISPFAKPRQDNPVTLWRRQDPLSNEMTTLEIRKYDDARGGFPDMRFGAILLYNASSPPIFPALSSLDLMPTAAPN